jgi:hypothetical protein
VKLPTSLTVAFWATGSLWAVALVAYFFDQPGEIVVGAFVIGCVTAWIEIFKRPD